MHPATFSPVGVQIARVAKVELKSEPDVSLSSLQDG